jgi:hypothetical protein
VLLTSLALTVILARDWSAPRRRWLWAGLLALCLGASTCYPIWLGTTGLSGLAPRFVEAWEFGPLHRWFTAALLVVVLSAAAAYRVVAPREAPADEVRINWRQNPASYYHERLPVLILLLLAPIAEIFARLAARWGSFQEFFSVYGGDIFVGVGDWLLGALLYDVRSYLWLAVMLLALQKTVGGWFPASRSPPAGPPRLALARYLVVWLALLMIVAAGVPTLAGFGFAVWLNSWHRLPWP